MINLIDLLICDKRPSQALIDYQLDNVVKKMMDNFLYDSNEDIRAKHEMLFDSEKTFELKDNEFTIYTQAKYFDEIIDDVQKSLDRYDPFLKFDPDAEDPRIQKINKKPEKIIGIGFCLLLKVTPQIKKAFLLHQELSKKESFSGIRHKTSLKM